MTTPQTEDVEAHHNEFDPKNKMPKALYAVVIATRDPGSGRRRKFIRTFLSKPQAKRYLEYCSKHLREDPEGLSLHSTGLEWVEGVGS